jgi:hypothetical protein
MSYEVGVPHYLLQLSLHFAHQGWLAPPGSTTGHKPKRVTGHFQDGQPGAGKAALFASTGRLLSVN